MSEAPEIHIIPEGKHTGTYVLDSAQKGLLDLCMAGDRAAQETFYKKYYGKMMSMCMRYVRNRDDAMEILNTGFLKVFKNLGNYQYNGPLEAWIYRIIYNSVIDAVRKRSRELKTDDISDSEYEIASYAGTAETCMQKTCSNSWMSCLMQPEPFSTCLR